jgi:uncharacterized membrane protein YbjE (DUF340 family)
MFVAAITVSLVLATLLAVTAMRKLSHTENVVRSYARAGVPEEMLNYLAAILIAGALGLIIGLYWAPLGIAAAIGLVLYFLVAVAFHIRADDTARLPTPVTFGILAVAALVLRIATS